MKFRSTKQASGRYTRRRFEADAGSKPVPYAYYGRRQSQTISTGNVRNQRLPVRQSWLPRLGLMILTAALLASVLNVVSLSSRSKVLPLNSGAANLFLHDLSTYQAAADRLLARSIWNRNKLTINTAAIDRQLLAQFPELVSVHTALPLLAHRPVVYLQTAQPALILSTAKGDFLIDSAGKALLSGTDTAAGKVDSAAGLPRVTDTSGLNVRLGRQALTRENVEFIQTVVAQLKARGVTIEGMTLPPGTSQLDVKIAGQPYYVKFNLHSDTARQQAGTYLATIAQLKRQGIMPAQYIDVRVDGRAYYR